MSTGSTKKKILLGITVIALVAGFFWLRQPSAPTSSPSQATAPAQTGQPVQKETTSSATTASREQNSPEAAVTNIGVATGAGETATPSASSGASPRNTGAPTEAASAAPGTPASAVSDGSAATGGAMKAAFGKFMGIFGGVSQKASETQLQAPTAKSVSGGVDRTIASSLSDAAPASGTSPLVDAPAKAPEVKDGCVTVSFAHKKAPGHTSDESCTRHKNLVRIKHTAPTSVCIRVNKTPVKYEKVAGKPNEFIIGAVAGPKAEITATYCVGNAACKENCVIPKDDFLSAIGGEDKDGRAPAVAQWDAEDKHAKDTDVYGNLDESTRRELDHLDQAEETAQLFQDWIRGAELPACGTRHAQLGN